MIRRRGPVRVVRLGVRRELTLMVGFALITALLVGVGAAFASRTVAQRQALAEAERSTRRLADLVVAPLFPRYLDGDPTAGEELDRTVANRVADGFLTETTVWTGEGRVLYSNQPGLTGVQLDPPAEVAWALRGTASSGFEQDHPEGNGPPVTSEEESGGMRYVEVYVPFTVPGRAPMVFEAYYDYQRVEQVADSLLRETLPLVVGPLLLLQLIQIPAAVSLARRLKRHERERARLLERTLSASDRERVRFAADLHDGPIQDLAGMSYALGAVAPSVPERHGPLMARIQDALQRSISSLRTLMTDLYPPDLASGTLEEKLGELTEPLRADGIEVRVDVAEMPPLCPTSVAALYRVVRESVTNIGKHAQASLVKVSLDPLELRRGSAGPWVRLVVEDDGVGLDLTRLDRRQEGHLGLRLLADRVETLGGELSVTSSAGEGTRLQVELPAAVHDPDGP